MTFFKFSPLEGAVCPFFGSVLLQCSTVNCELVDGTVFPHRAAHVCCPLLQSNTVGRSVT